MRVLGEADDLDPLLHFESRPSRPHSSMLANCVRIFVSCRGEVPKSGGEIGRLHWETASFEAFVERCKWMRERLPVTRR